MGRRHLARLLPVAPLAALLLGGCGTSPLSALFRGPLATLPLGANLVSDAGGEDPALLARPEGGYLLAYATTGLGDRHVRVSSSADGRTWSTPAPADPESYSDRSPCLWEGPSGPVVTFSSNRSGTNQLYRVTPDASGGWGQAVPMFNEPAQVLDSCVTRLADGRYGLVYQTLDGSVLWRTSSDGALWSPASPVAGAGNHPRAATAANGTTMVVFEVSYRIYATTLTAGGWATARPVDGTQGQAEDPVVAAPAQGGFLLLDAERGANGWSLFRRNGAGASWSPATPVARGPGLPAEGQASPAGGGTPYESNAPALAAYGHGSALLAWGIHTGDGRSDVACSTPLAPDWEDAP